MVKAAVSLSVVLCLISWAHADAGKGRVQAELVPSVSAIQPGKPFWAGIKFTIEPGYHIYWKNPGDSGLATQVKLKLPDGFTAGDLMFPVPDRLQLPGDIINYAYEKQVMLLVQITPPKDLPIGQSVNLAAKANWLVCKDDCMPGQAKLSLDLPVADTAAPANEELFKDWGGRLSVQEDSADIISSTNSAAVADGNGQGMIKITWKNAPSDVQYIPGPMTSGEVENVKVVTTANTTAITFDIKSCKDNKPITGLVTFTAAMGTKTGLETSIHR